MLTRDNFIGSWAGLPVAWSADDTFDEKAYRDDARRCCQAGMPGIYTGGTTGMCTVTRHDALARCGGLRESGGGAGNPNAKSVIWGMSA